jgi:hypothetical protein
MIRNLTRNLGRLAAAAFGPSPLAIAAACVARAEASAAAADAATMRVALILAGGAR